MQRDTEIALIERCLAHLRAGSTQQAPREARVPVSRYTDPDLYLREMDRLFRRLPQVVGPASRLAGAHDFMTTELAGTPILVSRDGNGAVGAFINVCRHRGARVVGEASGNQKHHSCPYHAWTYASDGTLAGVPHPDGFPDLDRTCNGLVRLPTEEHLGLIWVTPAIEGAMAWDDFMPRDLAVELDDLRLGTLVPWASETRVWKANWKLILDGGLEAYHFRQAHRRTIAPDFPDNCAIWDLFGYHVRSVLPRNNLEELANEPRDQWDIRAVTHMVYQLTPSASLLVQHDNINLIRTRPLAIDRSEIEITTLVPAAKRRSEKESRHWQRNHEIACAVLSEDFLLAESIQSGLRCGANDTLRFGLFEGALQEMRECLDTLLETWD